MPIRMPTPYNELMKKRYLYALLFGLPGFFVSGILSLFLFGASLGALWIFVFGDDPWPASIETILPIVFGLAFLLLWIGSIAIGYQVGKRLEANHPLNRNHIWISLGLTGLFVLFLVLQQFGAGNIGPKSDSVLCSEYCVQRGYAGSGMPPQNSGDRTCSCYDNSGMKLLSYRWIVLTRIP